MSCILTILIINKLADINNAIINSNFLYVYIFCDLLLYDTLILNNVHCKHNGFYSFYHCFTMLLNTLTQLLMAFMQFYFIYIIKRIILSSHPANDFSQSAIREKIAANANAHPDAFRAIKFTVLIFTVIFLYKSNTGLFDIESWLIRTDWQQTERASQSMPNGRISSCQIRSIDSSQLRRRRVHFTRVCTYRHVRATRTGPTPFNYWIEQAFTAVKGN